MATGRSSVMQMIIFGCGYSGTAIAAAALAEGASVTGTTRTREKTALLAAHGIVGLEFDGIGLGDDVRIALSKATHLVQSIPPGASGDPLLKLASEIGRASCRERVCQSV